MRQTIKRYVLALDDTLLLTVYAACWMLALFAPSSNQLGLATVGRVLSAVALAIVALLWIAQSTSRLGWRLRDIGVVFVVLVAVFEAYQSLIRSVALLDLLQTLELAAIFVTSACLCARRPQPLFLITLLMLVAATAIAWRWRYPLFPTLDPVVLSEITVLAFLAMLPWLAVRVFRPWGRRYHWFILGVALLLVVLDAAGAIPGHSNWNLALSKSLSAETRQVMASILREGWLVGCGPGHYEWLFRASMPEEFASQIAMAPGALMVLIERGAIGLVALLAFAAAALWRFRPGSWVAGDERVLDLGRPLRWFAAFVFLLFFATPALRSTFGQIVLWSLFGMLRGWSSEAVPAAGLLVSEKGSNATMELSAGGEQARRWYRPFLVVAALLAGIGLVLFHVRPLVGAVYRRCPPNMSLSDPAFLDRIDLARWWWPYDPHTHELEAAHYRAKANIGQSLSRVEIERVTLAYERMIRSNPYDPMNHHALARWKLVLGDIKRAIEATRRGLAYCPASFELQYFLAGCYRRLDNVELARAEYLRAHQLKPRSTPVLLNLAYLELGQGNAAEARRYLQLAHQILPDDRAVDALIRAIETGQTSQTLDQSNKESDSKHNLSPAPKDMR